MAKSTDCFVSQYVRQLAQCSVLSSQNSVFSAFTLVAVALPRKRIFVKQDICMWGTLRRMPASMATLLNEYLNGGNVNLLCKDVLLKSNEVELES
ncbi:uncharacterized protein Dsimw501_GD28597 [Drosophila simulans]|nr:uncharacterized protein Dsimw501_GD28597 [Drosophila simulans]